MTYFKPLHVARQTTHRYALNTILKLDLLYRARGRRYGLKMAKKMHFWPFFDQNFGTRLRTSAREALLERP